MGESSNFELFLRALENGTREFLFDICPWALLWLGIAGPAAWLVIRLNKGRPKGLAHVVHVLAAAGVVGAVCAVVHGAFAFGEAFSSVIDKDRMWTFVVLTAVFPVAVYFWPTKMSQGREN